MYTESFDAAPRHQRRVPSPPNTGIGQDHFSAVMLAQSERQPCQNEEYGHKAAFLAERTPFPPCVESVEL